MTKLSIWTEENVAGLDCARKNLMSASCSIGLRDELAQDLDRDVLRLLNGMATRSPPELEGRRLSAAPH